MIDLHSHTDESDGTTPPADLIDLAVAAGLEALAITDHDTFTGYDEAAPIARELGLDLVCGIEISTEYRRKNVHLLAYWPSESAGAGFRAWLLDVQAARHQRNIEQVARLRSMGLSIQLEDAQVYNPHMTGRPHFARALVSKGYASSIQDAFTKFLGESAPGFVHRRTPALLDTLRLAAANGAVTSLAHPIRLSVTSHDQERQWIEELASHGLRAIEAYHSDHSPADTRRFLGYAEENGLLVTGGSDFHGENKPDIDLGIGKGNLSVPRELLDRLRDGA